MKVFLLIVIIFLISCSSKKAKTLSTSKETELKTYFTTKYRDIDSTATVDSFIFVRLNNITLMDKYVTLTDLFINKLEYNNQLLDLRTAELKSHRQLMNLYSDLSQTLYETKKEDVLEALDSAKAISERGHELTRKMNYYDSLSKISDSTNAVGYEAVCFYQIRRKDLSVKKDTAYITMNVDKKTLLIETNSIKSDP